jgi:hypothetical protein
MAVDYVIDYPCVPKQALTTEGILDRLKGRERAQVMIRMYREAGDERPPSEIGFEFTRRTGNGKEETMLVVVQHLLDEAADLDPLEHHCVNCPANRLGKPFGCMSFIQYPISRAGEEWLLAQLPGTNNPLIWLLLKQGVESFQYDGTSIRALRASGDTYFEARAAPARHMGDFLLTSDQVFEMLFGVGDINPNHGSVLLLFFDAMPRDTLQANEIMHLAPAAPDAAQRFPFRLAMPANDEATTAELKGFLHALYIAWLLNVILIVDA